MAKKRRPHHDAEARRRRAAAERLAATPPEHTEAAPPEHTEAAEPPPEHTEASAALVAALAAADLPHLAERAAVLRYDENWGPGAAPLLDLYADLVQAGHDELAARVKAGDFDATDADNDAWYATAQGAAEAAQFSELWDQIPETDRDRFTETLRRLGANPAARDRLTKPFEAELLAALGITEPAPDDDAPIDWADINPHLHHLRGTTGRDGVRLDTPEVLACAEVVGRSGGTEFEMGWVHNHGPTEQAGWYAQSQYATARGPHTVRVDEQAGPNAAARAMVEEILSGGLCIGCRRVITLDPAGVWARDKVLANGQTWTAAEQKDAGVCLWRRHGPHWRKGCQGGPGSGVGRVG